MTAQNTPKEENKQEERNLGPLKILLTWSAPSRLFKKHDREYYSTIFAIAFLLVIILFFFKEWLLIMVIIAMVFVSYVFANVPPDNVEHQITNRGVISGGKNYNWDRLEKYWLAQKWEQKVLNIETKLRFPGRLILLLGDTPEEEVKKILSEHLPYEEPEKTWMDNTSEWLSRNIPLEK